jgi:hypothetical protein
MCRLTMLLLVPLASCAQDAPTQGAAVAPATAEEAVYACQMRGAAAEEAYSGRRNFSIDSAMVRAQATDACLEAFRRRGVVPR